MLMYMKYIILILGTILILLTLVLFDLERQQNLAEAFAQSQIIKIISDKDSLSEFGFPASLLGSNLKRADTNYTFTQWEIIFAIEKGGYAQVYVKPKLFFIIPIFNFKNDFKIDYINYEKGR